VTAWRWITAPLRWIKAVVVFLVDFIIGDDWTVAAGIAVGLLLTWRLVAADIPAWWLLPLVVLGANVQSLYRTVRKERAESG